MSGFDWVTDKNDTFGRSTGSRCWNIEGLARGIEHQHQLVDPGALEQAAIIRHFLSSSWAFCCALRPRNSASNCRR